MIKGDQPLSLSDIGRLKTQASKTGNTTLMRRANLAKTLKGFPH